MLKRPRIAVSCCSVAIFGLLATPAAAQTTTSATQTPTVSPSFKRLLSDTATDFKRLPSRESAQWLAIGATAALLGRTKDTNVTAMMSQPQLRETFGSGQVIGGAYVQMGGAIATYTAGWLTNSPRTAQIGADLIRSQIVVQVGTQAMKYAFQRTRPDGTHLSFPSGHTSSTFASATVLQRHLGWKAGLPAYGVAAYVAASRVQMKRHYLSDVAFGAALGIMVGRTVTIGSGRSRFAVAPAAAPSGGGAGVSFTLLQPD